MGKVKKEVTGKRLRKEPHLGSESYRTIHTDTTESTSIFMCFVGMITNHVVFQIWIPGVDRTRIPAVKRFSNHLILKKLSKSISTRI